MSISLDMNRVLKNIESLFDVAVILGVPIKELNDVIKELEKISKNIKSILNVAVASDISVKELSDAIKELEKIAEYIINILPLQDYKGISGCLELKTRSVVPLIYTCGKCRHCFIDLTKKQIKSKTFRGYLRAGESFYCYKEPIVTHIKNKRYVPCDIRNASGKCEMFEDIPKKESYTREYQRIIKDPSTWFHWKKVPVDSPAWSVIDRNRTLGIQEPDVLVENPTKKGK